MQQVPEECGSPSGSAEGRLCYSDVIDYHLRKGADVNYNRRLGKQIDLSDRIAIETGLYRGDPLRKIAEVIQKHPSTVSDEIRNNRTFIMGKYFAGKDCKFVRNCIEKHLCGADDEACNYKCKFCRGFDCTKTCERYESTACHKHESAPYVCNACKQKKLCNKDRFIYSAKYADAAVTRRRSESRQGFRISEEQFKEMDKLVTRLVKKGQPLTHIYSEHEQEMPICLRSLYNYIDSGKMTVKNIDLRRKTGYRQRRKGNKKYGDLKGFQQAYRIGRTYEDYLKDVNMFFADCEVTEMDTVKGRREKGKRLLTFIMRSTSIMLLFLLPDGTADSVIMIFDYLETGLGTERFNRLFPVFLTDNGGEFKNVEKLELNENLQYRTKVYYCDPMASWQKAHIEKNHEYIRYVIPRGKSLDKYTQEDMTLLMNHINSTRRLSLGNRAPYELINEEDEDMHALCSLLKMDLIPPDEVHLKPDLFVLNR